MYKSISLTVFLAALFLAALGIFLQAAQANPLPLAAVASTSTKSAVSPSSWREAEKHYQALLMTNPLNVEVLQAPTPTSCSTSR